MRKGLNISFFVIILIALFALAGYFTYNYFNSTLKNVSLSISREVEDGFIDYDETYQLVLDVCDTANNNKIISLPLDSLNLVLSSNPWIIDVKTTMDLNSGLDVKLVECKPVMRIYNSDNESVYVDMDGFVFPVENDYRPRLLIGSGNADFPIDKYGNVDDDEYINTDLPKMFNVMKAVLENEYSSCCVKQIFLDKNKNFKFSMNNTDIIVIFGDDKNIEEKLFRMEHFFMRMQGNPELENYKEINVNFNNQVICTKNKLR